MDVSTVTGEALYGSRVVDDGFTALDKVLDLSKERGHDGDNTGDDGEDFRHWRCD